MKVKSESEVAQVWLNPEVVYRHLKQNAEELRIHAFQAEIKKKTQKTVSGGKTFLETQRKLLLNL